MDYRLLRWAFFVLLASLLFVPCYADGKLVVESRAWDAGEVELGAILEHDFILKNVGDSPVKITDVSPQCGCTVPEYPSIIPPGESGAVHLVIKTGTLHTGKNSKTTTVRTDARGAERLVFQVKMKLYTPLELLPKPLVYLRSVVGQGQEQKILARPHREGMKITGVSSNNPNIAVSFELAHSLNNASASSGGLASLLVPRDGDAYVIVKLLPTAKEGLHRAEVLVHTSDPEFPEAVIKVNIVVKGTGEEAARS